MLSTLSVSVPPATEPVSIEFLRAHLRVDTANDDFLLASYLTAARAMAELYLSRVLVTQTLTWTVTPVDPVWPRDHVLHWVLQLPRMPVQEIVSVTVTDERGNETVVPAATLPVVPPTVLQGYKVNLAQEPARLWIGGRTVLIDGRCFDQVNLDNVQVEFVAGYAAGKVPEPIINAILMTAANLYEHRGDEGEGAMPRAIEWLLDPYRIMWSP
jgi:uncharacterized phiE125 gp8 family phage protein